MVDIREHAIRFADLWAVDPHQMVDEIYADGIVMENMANPDRFICGAAQLHAVEDELAARIPEHRHELVCVIVGEGVACLETIVVGPTTHEYAPACVWWWLDDAGKVAAEVGWFDWNARSTDSSTAHGIVPPNDRRRRGPAAWYESCAERWAEAWSFDPDRGGGLALEIHRALGDGAVIAVLAGIGDESQWTRGTFVLTLDADDRVISERSYWSWAKATPRAPSDRVLVGSVSWTL